MYFLIKLNYIEVVFCQVCCFIPCRKAWKHGFDSEVDRHSLSLGNREAGA